MCQSRVSLLPALLNCLGICAVTRTTYEYVIIGLCFLSLSSILEYMPLFVQNMKLLIQGVCCLRHCREDLENPYIIWATYGCFSVIVGNILECVMLSKYTVIGYVLPRLQGLCFPAIIMSILEYVPLSGYYTIVYQYSEFLFLLTVMGRVLESTFVISHQCWECSEICTIIWATHQQNYAIQGFCFPLCCREYLRICHFRHYQKYICASIGYFSFPSLQEVSQSL